MKNSAKINNYDSFEEILNTTWEMLSQGVTDERDPFHTAVLGSTTPNGCSLRTVVLRQVLLVDRTLICHSDRRSSKVKEIQADPRVSWLFYHPQRKVQLRLAGQATLHLDDHLADQQWATTKLMSRRHYCAALSPGTPSEQPTSGLPEFLEARAPDQAESEVGRKNFVVIACRIDFLDWLYLSARGQRRAQFFWGDTSVTARWVAP